MRAHRLLQRRFAVIEQIELVGLAWARLRREARERVGDPVPADGLAPEQESVDSERARRLAQAGAQLRLRDRLGEVAPHHWHMEICVLAADEAGDAQAKAVDDRKRQKRRRAAGIVADQDRADAVSIRLGEGAGPFVALIGREQAVAFQRAPVRFGLGEGQDVDLEWTSDRAALRIRAVSFDDRAQPTVLAPASAPCRKRGSGGEVNEIT